MVRGVALIRREVLALPPVFVEELFNRFDDKVGGDVCSDCI